MRCPYRDFKRDWHPGDRFCRCRSIKMRFYRHIDIYKVEFMLNKYLKRWVQFVDTVIWVTNTTEYTELIGSEVASKWFSHSWMIARTLPKQAHPGRRSPPRPLRGHGRLRRPWGWPYYWTGTKFRAAGSKFWSAKSRVRVAGVTENAGRTCRKLSGIKRFFASRE